MDFITFFMQDDYFEKESTEEDLKYALLHGSLGLQQHVLDREEKLIIGNPSNVCYLEYLVNYVIS